MPLVKSHIKMTFLKEKQTSFQAFKGKIQKFQRITVMFSGQGTPTSWMIL